MLPEERALLEKSIRLGEDNNKILRSMKRSQRWSSIFRAIYWILIIGSAFGAYYFIQPYFDQVVDMYNGAKSNLDSISGVIQNFKK